MSALDAIHIILVGTQHPGNIGAAARAMKTMGLTHLKLVQPQRFPDREAYAMAAGADDVLEQAERFETLADAMSDCGFALGCTARRRGVSLPEYRPREASGRMLAEGRQRPVALIFGRERTGLTNEELQRCHAAVHIPANPAYSSLNIAAAVQVLCYELHVQALDNSPEASRPSSTAESAIEGEVAASSPRYESDDPPANQAQLERFFTHLDATLHAIDFHKGRAPEVVMQRLRRLTMRATPDERELRILHGILADAERMAMLASRSSGN
ncbi:MAG: RNA methyltransferase [Xanthomonadales bacterium]|nr:RNA methyltransferase [Xanthomonadales bacterium]